MKFRLTQQDDDCSCGVFALETLLAAHGIPIRAPEIRRGIKPHPKSGTSHVQITTYLAARRIPFHAFTGSDPWALPVPCLVNYQWGGDGHYGTIVRVESYFLLIANPGNGELETIPIDEFAKSWYSTRYGRGWVLRIL